MGLAITLTFTNFFHFVALLSPLFIIFFIIITSIISNQLAKGLILNMGILIVSGIIYLLKNTVKSIQSDKASPFCNVLPEPFTVKRGVNYDIYDTPSLSSGILSFVTTYLIYPMIINNQLNPAILSFLIVILVINFVVEYYQNCCKLLSGFMGVLIGMIFAMVYYTILRLNNNDDLLYFTKVLSDNTQCSKPLDKTFRCTIYKNGVALNS